jgi:hypothetical protein
VDKKAKKRIKLLQEKRTKLRNELSVVRKFPDDPAEIPRLEKAIADIEAELEQLKAS